MAYTITEQTLVPVGDRMMFFCKINDGTAGDIITGLSSIDHVSLTNIEGQDVSLLANESSNGTITLAGTADNIYTVKAIGR